jgi:hypothetical protein
MKPSISMRSGILLISYLFSNLYYLRVKEQKAKLYEARMKALAGDEKTEPS